MTYPHISLAAAVSLDTLLTLAKKARELAARARSG